MLTVTQLARECGLSRSAVLYYESIGLLRPATRSSSNYRRYGERELARLRQICVYRESGLKLEDIRKVLSTAATDASSVLERRLAQIGAEIEKLRGHQRSIVALLQRTRHIRRAQVITKDKWVEIMRAAGLTEADMHRWHTEFEKAAPQEHEEFLQFLHIPPDEIRTIREWSRKGAAK
jgi:DNA-binding transcriptional MerR regulator